VQQKIGSHVARAAMEHLHYQADLGSGCPLTMTFSAVPALIKHPNIYDQRIFLISWTALCEPLLVGILKLIGRFNLDWIK
jgi:hypothetical protein